MGASPIWIHHPCRLHPERRAPVGLGTLPFHFAWRSCPGIAAVALGQGRGRLHGLPPRTRDTKLSSTSRTWCLFEMRCITQGGQGQYRGAPFQFSINPNAGECGGYGSSRVAPTTA
ncbi:hypothetical protein CC1G_10309 [Coprinopsis cinerea okayama7|uniref:Uncharacterized protein n=1 Tax=Coprinopsis cinerea (strain Okayama-7 / 130 / ATCC MYA-4618 / FGSC 9003) TaxID=240176 RepID=A8P0H2_COPC7|nr:hypothetical protein CC1G_10309 [Coprinopsis cinerea okayama7\|eukprot:XP_001837888.2 hypothetical protein CC1G_10309 [Coprinopsis cinerea okayama7\